MSAKRTNKQDRPGISKVKLAIGAASLFLFIIGLKRSFRIDEAQGDRTPAGERPATERDSQGESR